MNAEWSHSLSFLLPPSPTRTFWVIVAGIFSPFPLCRLIELRYRSFELSESQFLCNFLFLTWSTFSMTLLLLFQHWTPGLLSSLSLSVLLHPINLFLSQSILSPLQMRERLEAQMRLTFTINEWMNAISDSKYCKIEKEGVMNGWEGGIVTHEMKRGIRDEQTSSHPSPQSFTPSHSLS